MQFKKTYNQNSKNSAYYYVDGQRVSFTDFAILEFNCKLKGLTYKSSYLYTKDNGRTESGFCYS